MSKSIVIDGNIGSGKSTVIDALQSSYICVQEPMTDWAPYLEAFYKDMNKNSLLFQMKVLQHHMLNKNYTSKVILERSPLSCIHVFGQNLYDTNLLSSLDMNLMIDMNKSFGWYPSNIIYINTPPQICYDRIHERSRENEIIPYHYLEAISKLYDDLYIKRTTNIFINKLFIVDGSQSKEKVLQDIKEIIKRNFS
jgi:deoxyadenosine/deoxycytidine kinase